jgi:hypothetical protein
MQPFHSAYDPYMLALTSHARTEDNRNRWVSLYSPFKTMHYHIQKGTCTHRMQVDSFRDVQKIRVSFIIQSRLHLLHGLLGPTTLASSLVFMISECFKKPRRLEARVTERTIGAQALFQHPFHHRTTEFSDLPPRTHQAPSLRLRVTRGDANETPIVQMESLKLRERVSQ